MQVDHTRVTIPRARTPGAGRTLYRIKPVFVAVLAPIRDRLASAGVHADAVTAAALPVQVAMFATLVAGTLHSAVWIAVAPLALLLMALNALDGSLARATGAYSARGAVFNELTDRGGDLIVLTAGFFVAPMWIAFAAFAAVAASEMVAVVGWATTGERIFTGPMGKPDRAAVLAAGAMIAVIWSPALPLSFALIAIGAAVGAVVRTRSAFARAMDIDSGARR